MSAGILGELDRDIAKRISSKYDPNKEKEARQWIESVLGRKLSHPALQDALHDGVSLCHLINIIFPGSVPKIGTRNMPFVHRENISNYLEACKSKGMPLVDLFDTQDLYDGKNMVSVINHFFSLAKFSEKSRSFRSPTSGKASPSGVARPSPSKSPAPSHPSKPIHQTSHSCQAEDEPKVLGSLDRDLAKKMASKYDPKEESMALGWIESVLRKPLPGDDLQEKLKSGVVLCELMNALFPGTVKTINYKGMAFFQYLEACKAQGMSLVDLFDTQDLYDGKNIPSVIHHFFSLSSFAEKNSKTYKGPHIGAKFSEENQRAFTEEQLRKGMFIPSQQTVGSHGVLKDEEKISLKYQIIKNVDAIKETQSNAKEKSKRLYG